MILLWIGLAQAISYDLSPLGVNDSCSIFYGGWILAFSCENTLRFTNIQSVMNNKI